MYIAHRGFALPDRQQCGLVEQRAEVQFGVNAGQLQREVERPGQAFFKLEFDDLEGGAAGRFKGETQVALAGHNALLGARYRPTRKRTLDELEGSEQ